MKGPNLTLVRRCGQWLPKSEMQDIPRGVHGIYALLRFRPRLKKYDVVYIGMARAGKRGIRSRLFGHSRSKRKANLWSHFSLFEVWPNISEAQVEELEGLFREIYRKDKRANSLNKQKRFRRLQDVRVRDIKLWIQAGPR